MNTTELTATDVAILYEAQIITRDEARAFIGLTNEIQLK